VRAAAPAAALACAVALFGLAGALGAGAAAAPVTLPQVMDWAGKTLTGVDDWPLLGFDARGLTLASPVGATLRPNGLVEGDIRQEFFEPVELDGLILRSTSGRWSVDCAHQRYAVLRLSLFARNDLKAPLGERAPAEPVWLARDAMAGPVIDGLCEAVKNGVPVVPPPPS